MIIDVFNHFYPKEYVRALPRPLPNEEKKMILGENARKLLRIK